MRIERSLTGALARHITLSRPSLVAVAEGSGRWCERRIKVVWDKHSFPRYRYSINDNIFFLCDIAQKKHQSLLDSFYLDILRNLS